MDTLQVYSVRTNGQLPQGPNWEVGCTWHCSLFLFDMFSYVRVLFFQYMEESGLVQATVVAKEKIRRKHCFIPLRRNIFYCTKFFKDILVSLLNSKE